MNKNFEVTAEDKIFILFFTALVLLYVLPLLTSYCPFNDDYYRIFKGNSWDDDGRLLPSLIIRFLGHARTIFNPAPLPLVLSILVFSFGGFLIKKLFIETVNPYISALIAFGFIFNPFLLLSLVFQLDCLGFTLSLVLLILPFALAVPESRKKYLLYHGLCALCVFFSLNSYQSSLGFFMALATIEVVHGAYKNEYKFQRLLSRILQLVLGYVAYSLFLALPFIANIARKPGRVSYVELSPDGLNLFIQNCQNTFMAILNSFSQLQLVVLSLLLVISTAFVVHLYKRNSRSGTLNETHRLLLFITILSPLIIFLFSFIHLAFLNYPIDSKKLMFTSFSGFTAFLFLALGWYIKDRKKICCILIPIVLSGFGFSYVVGNLIKIEYEFHQPIVTSIVSNINDTQLDDKTTLYTTGKLARSRYFNRVAEILPIVHDLGTNIGWAMQYRLSYSGCGIQNYKGVSDIESSENLDIAKLPIIADSHYYQIYKYKSDLLLVLKEQ